jgi:hypothetical protein
MLMTIRTLCANRTPGEHCALKLREYRVTKNHPPALAQRKRRIPLYDSQSKPTINEDRKHSQRLSAMEKSPTGAIVDAKHAAWDSSFRFSDYKSSRFVP